jgi:predicted MFS family arabinose efflux permease
MAMLILLTGYFHSITGLSELVTSEALLPFLIAVGVMSLSSGYLCKYLGVRNLLLIVFIMALLGALTLLSTDVNGFRWMDWVAMVPIGLLAGSTSQLSRLALSNFTAEESMRGASLNTLVINLGLSLGAAYPGLVRSLELSDSSLENIIPKNQLLNIMQNEIMILILLFSVGIWQATKIKDAKV